MSVLSAANPIGYVEIPVADLERAVDFYQRVFDITMQRIELDGYDAAWFPMIEGASGATGALVKGDVYRPAKTGPVIYFSVQSVDDALERATAVGAVTLYPKTQIPDGGFVAEFEDSESNRIALYEAPKETI